MEPQLKPVPTDTTREELRGGVSAEGSWKLLRVVDGGVKASPADHLVTLRHDI